MDLETVAYVSSGIAAVGCVAGAILAYRKGKENSQLRQTVAKLNEKVTQLEEGHECLRLAAKDAIEHERTRADALERIVTEMKTNAEATKPGTYALRLVRQLPYGDTVQELRDGIKILLKCEEHDVPQTDALRMIEDIKYVNKHIKLGRELLHSMAKLAVNPADLPAIATLCTYLINTGDKKSAAELVSKKAVNDVLEEARRLHLARGEYEKFKTEEMELARLVAERYQGDLTKYRSDQEDRRSRLRPVLGRALADRIGELLYNRLLEYQREHKVSPCVFVRKGAVSA